jgi:DNA-binding NtrC family response regulator
MAIYDPSTLKEYEPEAPPQPTPASLAWSAPSAGEVRPPTKTPAGEDRPLSMVVPSGTANAGDADIEPLRTARRNATTAFELKYLEAVLSRSQGSIARAAQLSKVSRQMLQKLMRKHGVSMPR